MRAPTAVDPDLSSPDATSGIFLSFSSNSRKPLRIPFLIPSIISSCVKLCSCCKLQVNSSDALIQSSRWCEQCADTLPPACPSNTANHETVSFWSGIPMIAECASSISILHPCIEERPYLSPPPILDSLYFSVLGLSKKAPISGQVIDIVYRSLLK